MKLIFLSRLLPTSTNNNSFRSLKNQASQIKYLSARSRLLCGLTLVAGICSAALCKALAEGTGPDRLNRSLLSLHQMTQHVSWIFCAERGVLGKRVLAETTNLLQGRGPRSAIYDFVVSIGRVQPAGSRIHGFWEKESLRQNGLNLKPQEFKSGICKNLRWEL